MPQKKKKYEVILAEAWSSYSLEQIFEKLKDLLSDKPPVLELHIIKVEGNNTGEYELVIWNLLKTRDPATKLHVHVHASIYNATLLFLLIADKIIIRPHSWVFLESPDRILKNIADDTLGDEFINRFSPPPVRSVFVTNHLNICRIISEYLPIDEVADRRFPLEGLKDYLISEDDQKTLDMMFNS